MCVSIMLACLCTTCPFWCMQRTEEGFPGPGVTDSNKMVMWVLGTELWASGKAGGTLNL